MRPGIFARPGPAPDMKEQTTMADLPMTPVEGLPVSGEADAAVEKIVEVEAYTPSHAEDDVGETLQVLEETLTVSKRRRSTGSVRIGVRTEKVKATAKVDLDRYAVEVTRVPVGRVVIEAPDVRAEGDTTIIPVVEERMVVVKQLFLVEEVHIRHVLERDIVREPVTLRRQRVVFERLDPPVGLESNEETHDARLASQPTIDPSPHDDLGPPA